MAGSRSARLMKFLSTLEILDYKLNYLPLLHIHVNKVPPEVTIKLLENRPRPRGSKMSDNDLRRLIELSKENIKLMEELGCLKFEGDKIYYKTGCLGSYFQE
jgi:hypothetical protein